MNKEKAIAILITSVEAAQRKGTFLLSEASVLKKAVDYFNSDVKEKSDFGSQEPETVALNLLLQGVQKAQNYKECPYNLTDAAILYDVVDFLVKDGGKDLSKNVNMASTSPKKEKKVSKPVVKVESSESESDEESSEIRPISVSKKGKSIV